MGNFWKTFRQRHKLDAVMAVCFGLTIGLGWFGWMEWYEAQVTGTEPGSLLHQQSIVWFRTLRAFVFGDEYASPRLYDYNWKIILAGWLGALVAASALFKAGVRLFYGPWARLRACLRHKHVAILGDRAYAAKAAQLLAVDKGRTVTHHTGTMELEHDQVLSVPRRRRLDSPFMKRSLKDAERIIVAEESDSATAETCLRLAEQCPKTPIYAVFQNPWLAESLRHSLDTDERFAAGDRLICVSEAAASARTALAPAPPFLLAEQAGHDRVHMLIIGLGRLGEALIEDVLNTNALLTLRSPKITIIDRQMERKRKAFEARHPELIDQSASTATGQVEIGFVRGDVTAMTDRALGDLKQQLGGVPVTAVYDAVGEADIPLSVALAMKGLAERDALFNAPIFVRAREGCGLPRPRIERIDRDLELYAFGNWDEMVRASGVLDDAPDELARLYHESYCRLAAEKEAEARGEPVSVATQTDWEALSEALRMSNRWAVAHIPAKLYALGFDLSPFLRDKHVYSPQTPPAIATSETLYVDGEGARAGLARLEHLRWSMERIVDGWVRGPRDNTAKRHPDLCPFDELDYASREKDVHFAEQLEIFIERKPEGLVRRSMRDMIAGMDACGSKRDTPAPDGGNDQKATPSPQGNDGGDRAPRRGL